MVLNKHKINYNYQIQYRSQKNDIKVKMFKIFLLILCKIKKQVIFFNFVFWGI